MWVFLLEIGIVLGLAGFIVYWVMKPARNDDDNEGEPSDKKSTPPKN